jgi:hypothetical protein
MSKLRLFVCAVFLSVSFTAVRADELSGTWAGTMNATTACAGTPITWSSPAALALAQTGENFSGNLTIESEAEFNNCQIVRRDSITVSVTGRLSGGSISGNVATPGGSIPFSGSVNGNSMTVVVNEENGTRTFTVARTSSQPPDSQLTGYYEGKWNATFSPCCKGAPIPTGGTLTATLVQTGTTLTGAVIATGGTTDHESNGQCSTSDAPPEVGLMNATINGTSITGTLQFSDGSPGTFSATLNGTTISGADTQADCPGESPASFTMSKTSTTPPPSPMIGSFAANPSNINPGQTSTLTWSTQNAIGAVIDPMVGSQGPSGSVVVSPGATTTYTLTAFSGSGVATATTTVTVAGSASPRVVVGALPAGFVQRAGEGGGLDVFTLANIGDADTTLTLAAAGNFFTISNTSMTLRAHATQSVFITGTAQPAGSYEGTIAIAGNGAPPNLTLLVRMLSANPPAGTVVPAPSAARVEVASRAGQNATGSVEFTNRGTATLQGIAVTDVAWITPQSGVVTIPPGQTAAITYTVDSAKRPDAASPAGAVTGTISLVFISGSNAGPSLLANGAANASVSITIVHVVRPDVTEATPPPVAPGELAYIIGGLGNRANAVADLLIANRQPTPLSTLQLFLQTSGASQSTALSQLVANSSLSFPGVIKNVFNAPAAVGTAQIRGADVAKITVAAIQSNTASPSGTFSTALPVFRSDRGADPGGRIQLTGLLRSGSIRTDVYVQELTGNAGSFQIDFFGIDGRLLGTRPAQPIGAFGLVEVTDATPANDGQTVIARVANAGSGNTKLNAYALVTNATNGDAWLVTDPSIDAPASDALVVPILSAGPGAETILFATNRATSPVAVTVDVRSATSKRRSARKGNTTVVPPSANAMSTMTLAAQETKVLPITNVSSGYVRIAAPGGAISAVARSVREAANGNANGSALAAVPVTNALRAGETKRFPGVDDASSSSRSRRAPATFRTNLALVETGGQSAVVRITLQFVFAGGTLATGTASASQEISLAAGEFRLIQDLGREVIGPNRDFFGDLRNVTVDVEVVNGSGRVVSYLQSIDNGSGDMIVRSD